MSKMKIKEEFTWWFAFVVNVVMLVVSTILIATLVVVCSFVDKIMKN